jgi:hypothetical protein
MTEANREISCLYKTPLGAILGHLGNPSRLRWSWVSFLESRSDLKEKRRLKDGFEANTQDPSEKSRVYWCIPFSSSHSYFIIILL